MSERSFHHGRWEFIPRSPVVPPVDRGSANREDVLKIFGPLVLFPLSDLFSSGDAAKPSEGSLIFENPGLRVPAARLTELGPVFPGPPIASPIAHAR